MSTRSAQQASPREQLLSNRERERATTLKVLKAYPPDQSELRPHPRASSAIVIASAETLSGGASEKASSSAASHP